MGYNLVAHRQRNGVPGTPYRFAGQQQTAWPKAHATLRHSLPKMQFHDIFVVKDVRQLDVLAGVKAAAPDSCGLKLLR